MLGVLASLALLVIGGTIASILTIGVLVCILLGVHYRQQLTHRVKQLDPSIRVGVKSLKEVFDSNAKNNAYLSRVWLSFGNPEKVEAWQDGYMDVKKIKKLKDAQINALLGKTVRSFSWSIRIGIVFFIGMAAMFMLFWKEGV